MPWVGTHYLKSLFNSKRGSPSSNTMQDDILLYGVSTKIIYLFLKLSPRATRPTSLSLLLLITLIIFGKVYNIWSFSLWAVPCFPFIPLPLGQKLSSAASYQTSTISVLSIVSWGGERLSPLGTSATDWPIVPAPDYRRWVWSSRWNQKSQGKRKYSEKNCPSATLSTTNPTWPDLGSNPGLRGGKRATNRPSSLKDKL
jgi:hypothetical protein